MARSTASLPNGARFVPHPMARLPRARISTFRIVVGNELQKHILRRESYLAHDHLDAGKYEDLDKVK